MAKKDIGEFVRKSEFLSISQNNGILEKKKQSNLEIPGSQCSHEALHQLEVKRLLMSSQIS